ncbi:ABC transporter permease [Methyloprofundus sp.]|uniref:ABC transporter permease n=1 Tax=Methyloprofundus sp. TaxID=2020875 RepID=UPI003D10856C
MDTIETISLSNLALALIPALLVLLIFARWSLNVVHPVYALMRMLTQLALVGYALAFIFAAENSHIILLVLCIMCFASSWIALSTVKELRLTLYKYAFLAITIGGGFTLLLITQGTLHLTPWFAPHYMVPIAGMVFANSMNSVSLSAERLHSELLNKHSYIEARNIAFQAAMIPVINSLFAVGLVSLPGMMTGQILSGISPFIAARYQIMVMAMIFGSSGLSTALYLSFVKYSYARHFS